MHMLHVLGLTEPHSISQPFSTWQHLHCVRCMTWGKSRQTINITGKYSELQSLCSGCTVWRPAPLVTCLQVNDPSMQQQFIMSRQNQRETACTSRWPVELQTKRRKHQVRIMLYWNCDSSKASELLMTDTVQRMSTENALTCYTMVTGEKCKYPWFTNTKYTPLSAQLPKLSELARICKPTHQLCSSLLVLSFSVIPLLVCTHTHFPDQRSCPYASPSVCLEHSPLQSQVIQHPLISQITSQNSSFQAVLMCACVCVCVCACVRVCVCKILHGRGRWGGGSSEWCYYWFFYHSY